MTTEDKIKALGGIIDFGAVVSTPWGIYANGQQALPLEQLALLMLQPLTAQAFKHS